MNKRILVARKVAKEVNVEFKGEYKGNFFDKLIILFFKLPKGFTITRDELVRTITNGVKYYTKNPDGTFTEVEVVNYKKKYLRSAPNDRLNDNLDSLPTY